MVSAQELINLLAFPALVANLKKYGCITSIRLKYLTRLRLGFSHLREHKFKHTFLDCLNAVYRYGFDIESTCHYLFHCPNFVNERITLLQILS